MEEVIECDSSKGSGGRRTLTDCVPLVVPFGGRQTRVESPPRLGAPPVEWTQIERKSQGFGEEKTPRPRTVTVHRGVL